MLNKLLPVALGILLLCEGGMFAEDVYAESSQTSNDENAVVLTGMVTSVNNARVADARVELISKNRMYETQTDIYGSFRFEVQPSRYRIRVEISGYCPSHRPEFELAPHSNISFVLAVFPCSIQTSMLYKDGRYAGEECRYLTSLKEDIFPLINSSGTKFDLLVRYGEKQETVNLRDYQGATVEYYERDTTSPKGFVSRTVRVGVEINYNLMTITADRIGYNLHNAKITARGNVVIRRNNQTLEADNVAIDLRNGTITNLILKIDPTNKIK